MNIYELARELGNKILETEEAVRLSTAQDVYFQNNDAVKRMEEYQKFELEIKEKLEKNEFTQQDFQKATSELTRMGSALKKDAITGELISAQNAYNSIITTVVEIIRATSQGEEIAVDGSCSGGCSCGGKCH